MTYEECYKYFGDIYDDGVKTINGFYEEDPFEDSTPTQCTTPNSVQHNCGSDKLTNVRSTNDTENFNDFCDTEESSTTFVDETL